MISEYIWIFHEFLLGSKFKYFLRPIYDKKNILDLKWENYDEQAKMVAPHI
ncbi:MAG: hypothetical protein BAJALOKI3v1_220040 [Promethearchaeota archaeon]|jgi:hypothetical protein|nr:MAG: hypothetical protein BAJALOKI3v1_220040 [Candidatus Lokiarchaeota archaeon]